jgi:hypothetical protein
MATFRVTTLAIGEEGTTSTYGEEDPTTTSFSVGEEDGGPFYPEYQQDNPFGSY